MPEEELPLGALETSRLLKMNKPKFYGDVSGESIQIRLYAGFLDSIDHRVSTSKEYARYFEAVVSEFAKKRGLEPIQDTNRRFLVEPFSTPEH